MQCRSCYFRPKKSAAPQSTLARGKVQACLSWSRRLRPSRVPRWLTGLATAARATRLRYGRLPPKQLTCWVGRPSVHSKTCVAISGNGRAGIRWVIKSRLPKIFVLRGCGILSILSQRLVSSLQLIGSNVLKAVAKVVVPCAASTNFALRSEDAQTCHL